MLVLANKDLFEPLLIHDFHGEHFFGVLVHALYNFGEFALANLFHDDVLINDLFPTNFLRNSRKGSYASLTLHLRASAANW
jgi:hypothetical protein